MSLRKRLGIAPGEPVPASARFFGGVAGLEIEIRRLRDLAKERNYAQCEHKLRAIRNEIQFLFKLLIEAEGE